MRKGGRKRGKNDLFTTFSPWETSLFFFSLWLNKLFINVKSCLFFGSSPRTRHPWPMWMPAAGPEGQQGDQAEILKTDVGVCWGSICIPLCDFFFFFFFRTKGWRQQMTFTSVTVQELFYTSNGPGISRSVHLFTQHFGSHQHLTLW